jgi:hypothetical protein
MIRRHLLRALFGTTLGTYPGLGGQQPPPQNASPAGQLIPGIQPGTSSSVVQARLVIVSGPTGVIEGIFVYAPGTTPGPGNTPIAAMTNGTTDPFSNTVKPQISSQSGGQYASLTGAVLQFLATLTQFQAAQIGTGAIQGQLFLTSGLQTNVDVGSSVAVQSSAAAGGSSTIALSAAVTQVVNSLTVGGNATITGTLSVNGSTSTGGPDNTGFFNTQGLASGSYGSTHQHTLPSFPTSTHAHPL